MPLNFNKAEFVRSAGEPKDFLRDGLPQFAFAGRSNVGKSSVINRLVGRKNLAYVGASPGKTTHINYFLIDQKAYPVDPAGVGLRLHSIHPSITRESKWRYIMKKINLRELYPDVYATDFFVDVTEEVYKIEYYTIANQKQARYNIDKKTKATATVQKIDFGCSHKEQIENRYPQWLKTLVCSAWRKLFE